MRLDKKKMIAAIIVACTTLFIAIGIHEKKDTRKQLKFGATYMTMNNPYFVNMDENIEESVQAKGDILITRDPLQDQKKQNEQIKDILERYNSGNSIYAISKLYNVTHKVINRIIIENNLIKRDGRKKHFYNQTIF